MNKLYIPLLALVLAGSSATAQRAGTDGNSLPTLKTRYMPVGDRIRPTQNAADREIIWSDDFSNAATWVTGLVGDVDPEEWVIGTEVPDGAFAIDPIESTTADNGYALYDSDLYCGGNQHVYVQMAAPVDLSAYTGVVLQFEQFFRRFRGDCFVDVSTNGTDWTEIELNADVDVNDDTGNPDLELVNITSLAAGQLQVWIRFRYFSTVEVHGSGGGCDYAWMVDDVAFTTLPEYEIQMDYGFTSQTGTGEEYGRTPVAQFPPALTVGAGLFNFGGIEQTNVSVTTDILSPSGTPYTNTTNVGTIAAQATAESSAEITISPVEVGLYTADFTMSSDQIGLDGDITNNSRQRTFEVTDGLYSLDNIGNHPDGLQALQQVGSGSFTDNTENVKLMTMYVLRAPYLLTGLQIELGPATDVGSSIIISVIDTVDALSTPSVVDDYVEGLVSDSYVITQEDVDAGIVTIPFDSPQTLDPGAYYMVASCFADGDNDVFILDDVTVPQPALASALWIPFDPENNQNFYGGNGTAWAIRMVNTTNISVPSTDRLEGVTMFPNPTNGDLRINVTAGERHSVEVIDVVGKVVLNSGFIGNTVLDLKGLAKGVYNVRVTDGVRSDVQRVTLH